MIIKLALSLLLLSSAAQAQDEETAAPVTSPPVIASIPTQDLVPIGDDDDDDSPTKAPIIAPSTPPPPIREGDDDDDSRTELPVELAYEVGVAGGYDSSLEDVYADQLDTSMTTLATSVVGEIFTSRRIRRKLAVTVDSSAEVVGLEDDPSFDACPESVQDSMESTVQCAAVIQMVTLTLDDEDPDETQEKFDEAIAAAICEGKLQDILEESYPTTDLFIATCYDDGDGKGISKKSSKKTKKSKKSKKSSKKSKKGGSKSKKSSKKAKKE